MKKVFLLISSLFICSSPCIAVDAEVYSEPSKDVQQFRADHPGIQRKASDTEDSDDFYNELINEDYGCNQSPAFMNRGNINPNEADYGYGGTDGTY